MRAQLLECVELGCELVWVLGRRAYGFDRHSISAAIERLLEIPLFEVEPRATVRRA